MPEIIGKEKRYKQLLDLLSKEERIALAYSGGMDSAFLLWVCTRVLDRNHIWAVTFVSDTSPKGQLLRSCRLAHEFGVRLLIIPGPEIRNKNFIKNDSQRCYYCKKERMSLLNDHHLLQGFRLADGTQQDDLGQDRPGMKAGKEIGVFSPLSEAGIGKDDIRALSKKYGLSIANLPPESCLATRISEGEPINIPLLGKIDKAEHLVKSLGFSLVRIRCSSDMASLEFLPTEIDRAFALNQVIIKKLLPLGLPHLNITFRVYGGV